MSRDKLVGFDNSAMGAEGAGQYIIITWNRLLKAYCCADAMFLIRKSFSAFKTLYVLPSLAC